VAETVLVAVTAHVGSKGVSLASGAAVGSADGVGGGVVAVFEGALVAETVALGAKAVAVARGLAVLVAAAVGAGEVEVTERNAGAAVVGVTVTA
jgi:hypothetical protein